MAKFDIPDPLLKGFAVISQLDSSQKKTLLDVLSATKIGVTPNDLEDEFVKSINIDKSSISSLVVVIYSLIGIKREFENSPDLNTDDLLNSILEIPDYRENPELKSFVINLMDVSSNEALYITKKAKRLIRERNNVYTNSDIFTDIRPIFSDVEPEIKATVILYNLNISYKKLSQGSVDHINLQLALDEHDLKDLKDKIVRAEKKAEAIQLKFEKLSPIIKN